MYRRGKLRFQLREIYFDWILSPFRVGTFWLRHPKLWWMARRIDFHYWFGWPLPAVVGWNAIEA